MWRVYSKLKNALARDIDKIADGFETWNAERRADYLLTVEEHATRLRAIDARRTAEESEQANS